jgi:hypothetical protein
VALRVKAVDKPVDNVCIHKNFKNSYLLNETIHLIKDIIIVLLYLKGQYILPTVHKAFLTIP